EIIQKAWLDNPAFVTLDADGCLEGLAKKCETNRPATLVHLKLIERLDFEGLPAANHSLLTLVSNGSGGSQVYLFKIHPSDKVGYYTVQIVGQNFTQARQTLIPQQAYQNFTQTRQTLAPTVSNPTIQPTEIPRISTISIPGIEQGIKVALGRSLLISGSQLWNRINDFLSRIKAGQSPEMAMRAAGISQDLVMKLQQLGSQDIRANQI
ncbi:hypothetical protein NG798_27150, partial [Ancylothrix sp. C2]|uniref:hypothetical protein n=1 Tax=Ancylothrix sp. D3o TaxID=2953691 RepID=UPI00294FF3FC